MAYGKQTKLKFIESLKDTMNISITCDALGVPRRTFYYWLEHDKWFNQMYEEAMAREFDWVKSKWMMKINEGDMKAIERYIKSRGHKYGYEEKQPAQTQNLNITQADTGKPVILFTATQDQVATDSAEDEEGE